jgi:hypothetical protein
VGTPERHGPAWIVWHSGPNDDVYAGTRTTTRDFKASMHASGKFRIGLTETHMKSDKPILDPRLDRAMRKWQPLEIAPGVWCIFAIRQPASSVNMSYELPAKVQFVAPPADGNEIAAHIYVARQDVTVDFDPRVIGTFKLPSGATSWVRVSEHPVPPDVVPTLTDHRDEKDGHIRAFLPCIDPWGVGCIREIGSTDEAEAPELLEPDDD